MIPWWRAITYAIIGTAIIAMLRVLADKYDRHIGKYERTCAVTRIDLTPVVLPDPYNNETRTHLDATTRCVKWDSVLVR